MLGVRADVRTCVINFRPVATTDQVAAITHGTNGVGETFSETGAWVTGSRAH
jgi:hypothetical protein